MVAHVPGVGIAPPAIAKYWPMDIAVEGGTMALHDESENVPMRNTSVPSYGGVGGVGGIVVTSSVQRSSSGSSAQELPWLVVTSSVQRSSSGSSAQELPRALDAHTAPSNKAWKIF